MQFLYVLRLVPRLHDDAAWTDEDTAAVSRHFEHLKQATAAGKVILAGRTREPGDRTFGLVIFEAADEDEAQRFMGSDPAVVAGVMTATLHPYAVALQRQR
ncbi:MAG TPA: YciI family protein [Steroidobacteraceae bacterium]|nr:YciI family protein [Steroidobacteraceae bacterium]